MTTREYQEAYDDDSDNVRVWAAEDDREREREFAIEGDPIDLWDEIVRLRILCGKAADHLERIVAQRNAALAAIAHVEALASHWEQCRTRYISIPEAAAQLLQAIDESALGITAGPVE